jgi:hypothetical protein
VTPALSLPALACDSAVGVLEPQAPDAPRRTPRQDARRPRPAGRSTPARPHPRHVHQRPARPATASPRRL